MAREPRPPTQKKPKKLTHEELEKYALDTPTEHDDPESDTSAVEDEYTKKVARAAQAEIDQKALDANTVKNNDTKHYVTFYGARADGVTDDSGAFNKAIAAASVGDTIYVPRGTYLLSSSVTIASGTEVEFESGGKLSIASGKVFTVSGTLRAGVYQIFSGSGTVSLADGAVSEIHPAWWGLPVVQAFTAQDATPSVAQGMYFKTANASGTTITMFDDGFTGQVIKVIINDANTTVDFTGTNLKRVGSADWSPAIYSQMECVFDGTDWFCETGGDVLSTAVSVLMNGDQAILAGAGETLEFDVEEFDVDGDFDTGTFNFTVPATGKYLISFQAKFSVGNAADRLQVTLYNVTAGVAIYTSFVTAHDGSTESVGSSRLHELTSGDEIHLNVFNADSNDTIKVADTYMTIVRIQ